MKELTAKLIVCLASLTTIYGCGAQPLSPIKFQSRSYHFCTEREVENFKGKLCHRYCVKRKLISKRCKETSLIVEDLNGAGQQKFIDANFSVKQN